MPTRAMWKGVIRFGEVRVPVKLYAAVADHSVHFRLLHAKDQAPVKQALVNPLSDTVVTHQEARRAFVAPDGDLVVLRDEELAAIEPAPSRNIEVIAFLPPEVVDHRWYLRPYYLGPDEGGTEAYFGLTAALRHSGREGLAAG
jgi:DNA end-binding protein Ku